MAITVQRLPSGRNITDCLQFCRDPISLARLEQQLAKKVKSARAEETYAPLQQCVEEARQFAEYRERKRERVALFQGDVLGAKNTQEINFQEHVGAQRLAELGAHTLPHVPIEFIYHVDENGVYTRAFLANGEPLDADMSSVLDSGVNAWLDGCGMLSIQDPETGSVRLYHRSDSQETVPSQLVSSSEFSKALERSERGPAWYIQQLDSKLEVTPLSYEAFEANVGQTLAQP